MAKCTLCKKGAVSGNQISHAQNHTKRKFKANLQKVNGLLLCTRCLKTIKTIRRENAASEEIPAEIMEHEEDIAEQTEEDKINTNDESGE